MIAGSNRTVLLLYSVKGSAGSPFTSKWQPTKQSIPTIPSNMTGIKMINDALMTAPALPTPMSCCGWISPIHHQYYVVSGVLENWRKRESWSNFSFLKGIFFEGYIWVWRKPFPPPNVQTIPG
jgi:hypothetical protein